MNRILFTLLLLPLGSTCLGAVIFDLNDIVLDGNSGENTYIARNGTTAGLTYNGGNPSLTYTLNSTGYSYFVSYFDSQTLLVGDSLEISYAFTPSSTSTFGNQNESFRVGLLNSKSDKITIDTDSAGDAAFSDDRGYMAQYAPKTTPDSTKDTFFLRNKNQSVLWSSSGRTKVSDAPTLESPGTGPVTGFFRLTLQDSASMLLESGVNGNTVQSVVATSGLETAFDTLSFFTVSGEANPTLTFTDITITQVPEPSSFLLMSLAGVLYLVVGFTRRRIACRG